MGPAMPITDRRKALAPKLRSHKLAYVAGIDCAKYITIQLRVKSKKLPLRKADSPRKSEDRFIIQSILTFNYLK
jgi:hypothetical protein